MLCKSCAARPAGVCPGVPYGLRNARISMRRAPRSLAAGSGNKTVSGRSKTVSSRTESSEPQVPQAQPKPQQQKRAPSASEQQGSQDWDDLLSKVTPQREIACKMLRTTDGLPDAQQVPHMGDAADIVLMCLSTAALVALSMQLYRGYLLYSMYAAESTF